MLGSLHSDYDLKNEELKQMDVLDRASPSGNLGTKKLHTPTSPPKKPKGDGGDKKNKLEFDRGFYKNEAWWKVDIVFWELSKQKLVFYWENHKNTEHLASTTMQSSWFGLENAKIKKNLGTFVRDPNFNIISYCAFKNSMWGNKVLLKYFYHIQPL